MQLVPIYVLSANGERSPVNDHPFCLFNPQEDAQILEKSMAFLAVISAPSCRRGRQNAYMNLVAISLSSGSEGLAVNFATNCYRQNGTR